MLPSSTITVGTSAALSVPRSRRTSSPSPPYAVETGKPDAFYSRLTELAASGEYGVIEEVTSPDDNLQAVFQYLVK